MDIIDGTGSSKANKQIEMHIGQTFDSEEEAFDAYNLYAYNKGFSVRLGKKYYTRNNELRTRTFLCSCEGFGPEDSIEQNRSYYRTIKRCGCKAYVRFRIENGKWVLIEYFPAHNHAFIDDSQKHLMRSSRKISETSRGVLSSMVDSGIRPTRAYSYLKNEAKGTENINFTLKDCQNFFQSKRRETFSAGDCQSVLDHFQHLQAQGNNFYYSVQVDNESRMVNLFWCDGLSKIDYQCFGDVVLFDSTYRTNKYNMICAPFVGVNHHWKNVIFGCAFLLDETIPSFVWAFQTFLRAMGKAPKTIFTDQDQAMANAIEKVFPETKHRLCVWHISKNAAHHLSHLISKPKFKDIFLNKLLHGCESIDEFESSWSKMVCDWELGKNSWLNRLYDLRHKWSHVFSNDVFSAGIRSTQRSESTNNIFQGMASKVMLLTEFINHYEKQLESMRDIEVSDDFECARGKQKLLIRDNKILSHASDQYTHAIFKKFQKEFLQSMSEFIVDVNKSSDVHIYTLVNERKREHIVNFNPIDCTITCSCKLFESKGWLCRHALYVLNFMHANIPSQYILKRWTKYAKDIDHDVSKFESASKPSKTIRLNRLMRHAFSVMSLSLVDDESEEVARQSLHKLEKELKSLKTSKVIEDKLPNTKDCKTRSFTYENGLSVLDPVKIKPKGVSNKRIKSCFEKRKKRKSNKEEPRHASDFLMESSQELLANSGNVDTLSSRYFNESMDFSSMIMHSSSMPNTILSIQDDGTVEDNSMRAALDLNQDFSFQVNNNGGKESHLSSGPLFQFPKE